MWNPGVSFKYLWVLTNQITVTAVTYWLLTWLDYRGKPRSQYTLLVHFAIAEK